MSKVAICPRRRFRITCLPEKATIFFYLLNVIYYLLLKTLQVLWTVASVFSKHVIEVLTQHHLHHDHSSRWTNHRWLYMIQTHSRLFPKEQPGGGLEKSYCKVGLLWAGRMSDSSYSINSKWYPRMKQLIKPCWTGFIMIGVLIHRVCPWPRWW